MAIKTIKWTPEAKISLNDSAEYIKKDNPFIARKLVKYIKISVQRLKEYPYIGYKGRVFGTREFKVSNYPYVVVYRVENKKIEIIQILHTSKKYPS